MKTEVIRQFVVTIECDEAQAEVICKALHTMYRKEKDENGSGYSNPRATILREARNVFAKAINRTYLGEDS